MDLGGDVMGVFPFGCGGLSSVHIGYPADRTFFTRSVFTGNGWWVSPKYLVTGDSRHCHDIRYGDIVAGPDGRLWMAWLGKGRDWYEDGPECTFVYCSDDGGASWASWRGAGFTGVIPAVLGPHVRLAPYRGQIAIFWNKGWTRFDGAKWTEPEKAWNWNTGPWHVTSLGEEIYVANETGPAKWYDGKAWSDFTVPGRTGKRGKIGVCGGKTLVFVETDSGGKKLLCWRKKSGGEWQGPQEILEEKTKIVKVAHERYAPEGFMPIAYMCLSSDPSATARPGKKVGSISPDVDPLEYEPYEPWIKVLKVPAAE
jgi:hypothetical protein